MSRLSLPWLIAWRYLRGERSQILSSTALAALAATTLGVMAMTLAMALMSGYTETLQRKLIGLQGDLVVSPLISGALDDGQRLLRDASIDGVDFVGRVAYGEGSIASASVPDGRSVVLRGIEVGSVPSLMRLETADDARDDTGDAAGEAPEELSPTAPASTAAEGLDLAPDASGVPGVVIGKELVRQLGARQGETVRLVVLDLGGERPRFRYRSAEVRGAFTTGFAEFDASWALLDRETLLEERGRVSGIDVLEVKLAEDAERDSVVTQIEAALGDDWHVQRWESLNKELFAALALQEALLFFVLGLIVVVSTFNTASTLVILVRERLPDIGVLASLGLEPRQLFSVFLAYGCGLGAAGILCGVALGSAVSWTITEFELVRFDPEVAAVYFIDSVPFITETQDLLAIVAFSLLVTVLACSIPARRAASLLPAHALRAA